MTKTIASALTVFAILTLTSHPSVAQTAAYNGWSDLDGDPPSAQSTGQSEVRLKIRDALTRGRLRPVGRLREKDLLRRLGRPVGRLAMRIGNGSRGAVACTAFLIAEDLILTNRHCIVDNPHGRVTKARLKMRYLGGDSGANSRSYTVVLAPRESDAELDYAIHSVKGDPGATWGMVELDPTLALEDRQSMIVLHHPGGYSQHVSLLCETGTPALDGAEMRHTCATFQGSSGAPVFDFEARTVVGLHYRTFGLSDEKGAKRLSEIMEQSALIKSSFLRRATVAPIDLTQDGTASVRPAPIHECDHVAAIRVDPGSVVKGLEPDGVVATDDKINTCRRALTRFPNEMRFAFQLATLLQLSGQYSQALIHYEQSAQQGYTSSMIALGDLHLTGLGVNTNLR